MFFLNELKYNLFLLIFFNLLLPNTLLSIGFIFKDEDSVAGRLSGSIKINHHTNFTGRKIEIFWGNNPNSKLGQYLPLIVIPSGKTKFKINLKNLRIPPGATHFIIDSVLENNHSVPILNYPIVDLGVPTSKAEGLSFQQTRSEAGRIQGEIRILSAFQRTRH